MYKVSKENYQKLSAKQLQHNESIINDLESFVNHRAVLPTGTLMAENGQHIRIGWIDSDGAMNDLIRFCQKHKLGFQYRHNIFFIEFPTISDDL